MSINRLELFVLILTLCFCGCSLDLEVASEREYMLQALKYQKQMEQQDKEPVIAPLGFYEVLARVLKYNLDYKTQSMRRTYAFAQFEDSQMAFWPSLNSSVDFNSRENFSGSVSQSLITGTTSLAASTSAQRNVWQGELDLSWDILDFGLSYARAKQLGNQVLIAREEERKVINNLIKEAVATYWEALLAQRMMPQLLEVDREVAKLLDQYKKINEQGLKNPKELYQLRRELLLTARQIKNLQQRLIGAEIKLASLMNLSPNTRYQLAENGLPTIYKLENMDLDALTLYALQYRPEMRAIVYQERITQQERKGIFLEMLPNLKLTASNTASSNAFLVNQSWMQSGINTSWNLFNILKAPKKLKTVELKKLVESYEAQVLARAVSAQVHISLARALHAEESLGIVLDYSSNQDKLYKQANAEFVGGKINKQELLKEKLDLLIANLEKNQSYADFQKTEAVLLETVGHDLFPEKDIVDDYSVPELADLLKVSWKHKFKILNNSTKL